MAAGKEMRPGVEYGSTAYLSKCILLFWGHHDIPEQESTVLVVRVRMEMQVTQVKSANFVQEIVDLLKLLRCKFAGMNAFHLSG
jgi:hypothetical protein